MKRYLIGILSLLLIAALLCGCGAEYVSNEAGAAAPVEKDEYYLYDSSASNGSGANRADAENTTEATVTQKLVRKLRIEAETDDLDALLSQIDQQTAQLGGYCESREVYNGSASASRRYRYATLIIRIPAEKLDQFSQHVSGVSNVTSSSETADDITLTYIATESRVKALQTEHDRLLELLAKAENMSDLLEIESRLTKVRTELEQIASQLKLYDNMVNYGTVTLNISEVKEYTVVTEPETVWERIGTGFMDSLKGVGVFFRELFVFVIVALPYLAVIAAFITALVLLIKWRRKKNKKAGK